MKLSFMTCLVFYIVALVIGEQFYMSVLNKSIYDTIDSKTGNAWASKLLIYLRTCAAVGIVCMVIRNMFPANSDARDIVDGAFQQ
jgi:hypothetical protein